MLCNKEKKVSLSAWWGLEEVSFSKSGWWCFATRSTRCPCLNDEVCHALLPKSGWWCFAARSRRSSCLNLLPVRISDDAMSGNSWRSNSPGSNCAQACFKHHPCSFIRVDGMSVINWNWIFPPIAWSESRSILHNSNPRRHPLDHQNISRVYLHVVPVTLVKIENRCVCQKFVTFMASTRRWSKMLACQWDWEGGICNFFCICIFTSSGQAAC